MAKTIPAVSIIIPMYNAEKYIGECLDSILAQAFDDYEVIVVDDCSTDDSCAVVESYARKFNSGNRDKLRLVKSKINSGGAGIPRNIGIGLSRGEYLIFVDSDDAITETALEELYPVAKKFDADVVHCEKHFTAPGETVTTDKSRLTVSTVKLTDFVSVPTLMSAELSERLAPFNANKFAWSTYTNFVRRSFIAQNDINFPNLKMGEDLIFTFKLLCLATNFVLVPNVYYIYRDSADSLCKNFNKDVVKRWSALIFNGIVILDEFMNNLEFFRDNPQYKYATFNLLNSHIALFRDLYADTPAYKIDALIREEIAGIDGDKTALTAFMFGVMNELNIRCSIFQDYILKQETQIEKLKAHIRRLQSQKPLS